ncbi:MAG: ClpP family protease [Dysosmobacter welbionis]
MDFGSALTKTPHGSVYCMTIIGQIEGHNTAASGSKTTKYEHVLPLLAKLEESDEVNGVLFLLNTVGGDVEAGLAIAELIAGMTKPTVSIVLGGSHSIGVPLAVAARRSFAVPSAAMTIHPVRMSGTVIAAPQTYNYFQRLQDRIVAFVSSHSQITAQKFQALMLKRDDMAADVGSVVYGEEAVSLGIIDQVGGLLTDSSASTARSRRPKESGRHPDLKPRDRKMAGGSLRAPRLSFISSGSVSSPVRPPSC